MKQLPLGASAPDFTLQSLAGRTFHLHDELKRGEIVLVFYKGSCPTCQLTFPYLQRIQNKRIWVISQDEPDETKAFVEQLGITFDMLIDPHPYNVSSAYNVEFVPTIFVVGQDGKIGMSDYGFSKATLSEIAKPLQLFSPNDGLPATRPG